MFGVPRPLQRHADTKSLTKGPLARNSELAIQNELDGATSCLDVYLNYFLSSYRWAHWWKALLHHGLQSDGSSAGYKSTESLLLGYFAAAHQDPRLLAKSRRSYGEGLRQISSALTFQPTETFAGLTLPIMILSMHPVRLPNSVGWFWVTPTDNVFALAVRHGQIFRARTPHWPRDGRDALRPWELPGPWYHRHVQILQSHAGM